MVKHVLTAFEVREGAYKALEHLREARLLLRDLIAGADQEAVRARLLVEAIKSLSVASGVLRLATGLGKQPEED